MQMLNVSSKNEGWLNSISTVRLFVENLVSLLGQNPTAIQRDQNVFAPCCKSVSEKVFIREKHKFSKSQRLNWHTTKCIIG